MDEILLLSQQYLRDAHSDGAVNARYIAASKSLVESLKTTSCSPLAVFYKDEEKLSSLLTRLLYSFLRDDVKFQDVGEQLFQSVIEKSFSQCLQQFEVSNVSAQKDVHFENAAITTVSCLATTDYFMPRCVLIFVTY